MLLLFEGADLIASCASLVDTIAASQCLKSNETSTQQ
jgi:hypothetical protein